MAVIRHLPLAESVTYPAVIGAPSVRLLCDQDFAAVVHQYQGDADELCGRKRQGSSIIRGFHTGAVSVRNLDADVKMLTSTDVKMLTSTLNDTQWRASKKWNIQSIPGGVFTQALLALKMLTMASKF